MTAFQTGLLVLVMVTCGYDLLASGFGQPAEIIAIAALMVVMVIELFHERT